MVSVKDSRPAKETTGMIGTKGRNSARFVDHSTTSGRNGKRTDAVGEHGEKGGNRKDEGGTW